eukprot:2572957-Rhodomonas_salina.1
MARTSIRAVASMGTVHLLCRLGRESPAADCSARWHPQPSPGTGCDCPGALPGHTAPPAGRGGMAASNSPRGWHA